MLYHFGHLRRNGFEWVEEVLERGKAALGMPRLADMQYAQKNLSDAHGGIALDTDIRTARVGPVVYVAEEQAQDDLVNLNIE